MQKLHFSITINASKEKVWDTLLSDTTYGEWTKAFNEGSYYKGDWNKGSKMLFLGPDPKTGQEGGMVAKVADNRPNEFMSIEYVGLIKDGKEDTTSIDVKKWVGGHENYTLKETDGVTEVLIDTESDEEMASMFEQMWPKALEKLKELSEK